MKRITLICILLLCSACAAVKYAPDNNQTVDGEATAAIVRELARHGDWILARGLTIPDDLVSTATNMPLSHAAVYDAENDNVIEADSKGVHTTDLVEFLSKKHRVMIIRPMWSTEETAPLAVENARALIGRPYDYSGLIGLQLSNSYYCTELAIAAYRPFITEAPENPIPRIIMPGQMYHWGRILFDTGA
ncbi:MAG: hypothetical protein LBV04_00685 [Deferribacteraceae bacterium]|jgi:uncharacterized protein YycO|nr:hypothetical protein [Deferribacteraceae bacterium]